MKESPRDQQLHNRLLSSKFSGDGFLGNDTRTVEEIVADDHRTLEQLGVKKQELVDMLDKVYKTAKAALGGKVMIGEDIEVVFHESMGRIPSPFRGDGVFEKGEAMLTYLPTGEQLHITALSIALIDLHGFFQGRGAPFRIDPETACRVLGL